MNITRLAIQRPIPVIVFFLLMVIMGIYSYSRLPYELVPKFTPPVITVMTIYPGASPQQVEENVSGRIEDALSSVENVELLYSLSRESLSLIRLELKAGTDVDEALVSAQRKLNMVLPSLPDGAETPLLRRFDFDDLPVIRMGLTSNQSATQLTELANEQIKPALSKIKGVAEVRLLGGTEREITVELNPDLLDHYGVSILQVVQAISMSNLSFPLGSVEHDRDRNTLRLDGGFLSLDEIRQVKLTHPVTRARISVDQLGMVHERITKPEIISRISGLPSLGLEIRKQGDANAVEMSALVREELEKLELKYRNQDLDIRIAEDSSAFTLEAANAVMIDLTYAIILVSLVMLVFLHSLRNSMIVLVSIPTSIVTTFIVMGLLGYSLNLLTLLGLSLAIGILVDDSIVVIENIYRHLEMHKSRATAAYDGRMEIGFTAVSITLIDVVVFLPIIFSSGMVADLLRQFAVVVLTSTLMSLLVSFTLVPYIASRIGKLERLRESSLVGKMVVLFERFIDLLSVYLRQILEVVLRRRAITLFISVLLLAGSLSLVLFGFIGIEFTKAGDRGEFILELEMDRKTTLDENARITRLVETFLLEQPEVSNLFTTVGTTSSGALELNTQYLTEVSVKLIDKRQRERSAAELARNFKFTLESQVPGLIVRPVEINLIGFRTDDAVQVSLLGNDLDTLGKYGSRVAEILSGTEGAVEVQSSGGQQGSELILNIDRRRLEQYGVSLAAAGAALRTAISGNTDNKYSIAGIDYDLNIRVDPGQYTSSADLLRLSVPNDRGQLIRLSQLASFESLESPQVIERTNRSASVTVKSQVIGKPAGSVSNSFKQRLANTSIPEDIELLFGGETKRTTDGLQTMGFAFAASILLVYFVLAILYNSWTYPLIVLLSIPMAVIGALLALALTMEALSIFSILGLVMLVGLVGKNAILVVDFANRMIAKGIAVREALLEATRLRFRPVLMTNISMIMGLLPIALAGGAGSEWKNGLAWALIGGLSSSMVLTLVIVPVVFTFFARESKEATSQAPVSD